MIIYCLKYYLYSFLTIFAFCKFKERFSLKKNKYQNAVFKRKRAKVKVIGEDNSFDRDLLLKLGVNLVINGNNNVIKIGKNSNLQGSLDIRLNRNNCVIDMNNISTQVGLSIIMGFEHCKTNNSEIIIKDNTHFNQVQIMMLENDSKLKIGNNCMFSGNVMLHLTDGHSITDYNGKLLNYGANVVIGDNVWVGRNSTILKNASIPDFTIIGMGSIVSKRFNEKNTIIAGVPAKIVKKDVLWQNIPPQLYKDMQEEKMRTL